MYHLLTWLGSVADWNILILFLVMFLWSFAPIIVLFSQLVWCSVFADARETPEDIYARSLLGRFYKHMTEQRYVDCGSDFVFGLTCVWMAYNIVFSIFTWINTKLILSGTTGSVVAVLLIFGIIVPLLIWPFRYNARRKEIMMGRLGQEGNMEKK